MASKRALVVGVNKYADDDIKNLNGACNDASEIRDILQKNGGFEIEENHFLQNEDATAENILQGLSDLLWNTSECDFVLIFFSGHGFADSYGTGYLAPHDMILQAPMVHGIEMQKLRKLALRSKNKQKVLIILDCCHAGIAAQGDDKALPENLNGCETSFGDLDKELEDDAQATGTIVISSSSDSEKSREKKDCQHSMGAENSHPHGEFTFHLLEGLTHGAETNKENWVSVPSLIQYVQDKMKDASHKPKIYGSQIGNFGSFLISEAAELDKLFALLTEVSNFIETGSKKGGSQRDLISAFNKLSKVYDTSSNFPDARNVKYELDAALGKCKRDAGRWLWKNRMEIIPKVPEKPFLDLEDTIQDLSFDELRKRPGIPPIVQLLFEILEGKGNKSKLITFLNFYEDPQNASPR